MKMIIFQALGVAFAIFMFITNAYKAGRNDGRQEVMTKWEESIKEVSEP